MTHCSNVLPSKPDVNEAKFHNAMIRGLSRAADALGSLKALAFVMDISTKQLGNIMAGASTDPKRLWDAHIAAPDADVMNDIAELYGKRLVDKNATCDTDNLNVLLARVLLMVNEATHPDSPGGRAIVHTEYLDGETLMRQVHTMSANWLEQCAQIRRPRGVAA